MLNRRLRLEAEGLARMRIIYAAPHFCGKRANVAYPAGDPDMHDFS